MEFLLESHPRRLRSKLQEEALVHTELLNSYCEEDIKKLVYKARGLMRAVKRTHLVPQDITRANYCLNNSTTILYQPLDCYKYVETRDGLDYCLQDLEKISLDSVPDPLEITNTGEVPLFPLNPTLDCHFALIDGKKVEIPETQEAPVTEEEDELSPEIWKEHLECFHKPSQIIPVIVCTKAKEFYDKFLESLVGYKSPPWPSAREEDIPKEFDQICGQLVKHSYLLPLIPKLLELLKDLTVYNPDKGTISTQISDLSTLQAPWIPDMDLVAKILYKIISLCIDHRAEDNDGFRTSTYRRFFVEALLDQILPILYHFLIGGASNEPNDCDDPKQSPGWKQAKACFKLLYFHFGIKYQSAFNQVLQDVKID
ncbi:unnamed protein product [Moneuplotes crassus]|uniref:Uncharacterized protein n=1 Tax=Euplotes crassus TaxID=5936 RepID=A0AAD1XHX3_EUPCR|nr:unnamed protein product [Moneuplotes crassus]